MGEEPKTYCNVENGCMFCDLLLCNKKEQQPDSEQNETIMNKEKPFNVDEEEILELIKQNKVETTWSLAMDMADKIYELSGDAELAEQYRSRYYDLYHKESEQAEKQRNDELDYFCGRHTFFPWEI